MRVCLLGHSQLRNIFIDLPNIEVLNLCKPGARFDTYLDPRNRREIERFKPDLAFVFLGSNDIDNLRSYNKLRETFSKFLNFYHCISDIDKIKFLEIEPRTTTQIDPEEYQKVKKHLNRRIYRLLRGDFITTYTKGLTEERLGRDGVHLDLVGRNIVREVIIDEIRKLTN